MREIVLDTETTGLDPATATGSSRSVPSNFQPASHRAHLAPLHQPRTASAASRFSRCTAWTTSFLRDKPVFRAVACRFLAFVADAPLVIHNAAFDIGFLDAELGRCGAPPLGLARAVDTLDTRAGTLSRRRKFARCAVPAFRDRQFGARSAWRPARRKAARRRSISSLPAAASAGFGCWRFRSNRQDAVPPCRAGTRPHPPGIARSRARPLAPRLTEAERAAHAAFLAELGADPLWRRDG
jgi:DNA polymerase-3 subunit epsilon